MTRELLLNPGSHGLGMTHASLRPDATATSVCGYCSTGCGLRIHLRDGQAVGLTPETDYPVNLGMACPKGWESLRVLESADRATHPLLRNAEGELEPVSWDRALTEFCERFKAIQAAHGADSVAFLSTGQIACEEMALLGVLAKFGMGLKHGDGNTRQCMATAVTAYKESFGFDAPPFTYEDFEQSDCLVFIGANPCIGHPIMWERVLRNQHAPEVIVVDPRSTETAMAATQHLQLRPKSDLVLLYAITRQLIESGYVDHDFVAAHTTGFRELTQHVDSYTPEYAAARTGLSAEKILRAAESIGQAKAASLWWTMGVNQSYEGVRTAQAIINIALITGNIGRPGTGANSITGQCNAMGSRLWSGTTNLFGHHDYADPEHREKIAAVLDIDPGKIPDENGWSYDRIVEGIRCGKIRGLWVIATNPAHSWIHQGDARELLDKLDFLVVQDMYATTETARQADLILPAAGWGEKEGTFINSERRYGVHRRVRVAPGEALADFQIFRAIGAYWGVGEMLTEWTDPEAGFRIMQRASRGQPCDITGIENYAHLDRCGGIQWPWSEADAETKSQGTQPGESMGQYHTPRPHRRLFGNGEFFTPDRRARLIVAEPRGMPELPDADFPMLMLTGRGSVSQWHTQTRTSKSPILRELYPNEPYVELHPDDASRYAIRNGEWVEVSSRRGRAEARALVSPTVRVGQVFMAMHYEETNRLTLSHFDPYSRQPSYKNCAVRLRSIKQ
ncbi:molybdopterin oxidoreductase family protein [Aureliella helgolandensis]